MERARLKEKQGGQKKTGTEEGEDRRVEERTKEMMRRK